MICLHETWLSENDDVSPIQIEGYNCVSKGKSCSNNGGLLLYIDRKFTFETKMNFNMYKHWEGITVNNFRQWLTQPTNNFQLISATKIKSNSKTVD